MFKIILCVALIVLVGQGQGLRQKRTVAAQDPSRADLPTLYEHFTENGINSGLEATASGFMLNGKPLKIVSGAMHYFRIHPEQWRDRLRKLRASGANTVETYVAWNLHEPQKDVYDFGEGNNDFSLFLNLREYIKMAQEEDLLVLFRPGPYICSEWEFGGMPSYLQRDPNMKVRQFYEPYLDRVEKFYTQLLAQVQDLQFTSGGPIVGLQIENEYGSFSPKSKDYIAYLVLLVENLGFEKTLLFTSDGVGAGFSGTLPDRLFMTANFQGNPEGNFDALLALQPNKPVMSMEFWTGWFDHWFEDHNVVSDQSFANNLEIIIGNKYNGSVNFYMFHGGTNFGLMAGANTGGDISYEPDVTSYDYDAPLTEAGDYGGKYLKAVEIIDRYETPKLSRPVLPAESTKATYGSVRPTKYLNYEDILAQVPGTSKFFLADATSMEDLEMNGNSGQSYGYLIHRKKTPANNGSVLKAGPVKDFAFVLVDGVIQQSSFSGEGNRRYWMNSVKEVTLENIEDDWHNVDLFIENMGRVNFGWEEDFEQKKGLPSGTVELDGELVQGFEVFALEFKSAWVKSLSNFRNVEDVATLQAPLIVQSSFIVNGVPADTFVDMTGWEKGIVFINGFNLGRYWNDAGPQQTLYLPAPFLKTGENTVTVFEQLKAGSAIRFSDAPELGRRIERAINVEL